jgi:hypothetical protein
LERLGVRWTPVVVEWPQGYIAEEGFSNFPDAVDDRRGRPQRVTEEGIQKLTAGMSRQTLKIAPDALRLCLFSAALDLSSPPPATDITSRVDVKRDTIASEQCASASLR